MRLFAVIITLFSFCVLLFFSLPHSAPRSTLMRRFADSLPSPSRCLLPRAFTHAPMLPDGAPGAPLRHAVFPHHAFYRSSPPVRLFIGHSPYFDAPVHLPPRLIFTRFFLPRKGARVQAQAMLLRRARPAVTAVPPRQVWPLPHSRRRRRGRQRTAEGTGTVFRAAIYRRATPIFLRRFTPASRSYAATRRAAPPP